MSLFFNDTATTEIYTFPTRRSSDLRLKAGLMSFIAKGCENLMDGITPRFCCHRANSGATAGEKVDRAKPLRRSEEHTSELQSQSNLVCRLLLEKKKKTDKQDISRPT